MKSDPLQFAAVTARVRLDFLGYRIDIRTNSLRVAAYLRTYWRQYLSSHGAASRTLHVVQGAPEYDAARMTPWARASSPGRAPKESYYEAQGARLILKNRTGVLIRLNREATTIAGDVDRHVNQVVNLIATMFGMDLLRRGYVMLHGSAVARAGGGDALVFLGNSGSGKSSVALQMVERGGWDFVSNDRVLLKVDGDGVIVVGLPKKPRVNPGTLLASAQLARLVPAKKRPTYEQMPRSELWGIEDKTDVDVARTLGASERLSARLGGMYALDWRNDGDGLTVEPLDSAGALEAMRITHKDFGVFELHPPRRDALQPRRRVAAAATFYRVLGRADPPRLAADLHAAFTTPSKPARAPRTATRRPVSRRTSR